jgi:hypothetical protein
VLPAVDAEAGRCLVYFCINGFDPSSGGLLGCKEVLEEWEGASPVVGKGMLISADEDACPFCW